MFLKSLFFSASGNYRRSKGLGLFFSSLTRWNKAVKQVPIDSLFPKDNDERKAKAFLGDKILGLAAASILLRSNSKDTGSPTEQVGAALSNSLMAAHVQQILPSVEDSQHHSDWELGTMIESAVSVINEKDPSAVTELVEFLLEKAKTTRDPNCKGRLLNLGGTVKSERIGGSDHSPVWTAKAHLNYKYESEATGSSKKLAETLAAGKVLDALPDQCSSLADADNDERLVRDERLVKPIPLTYYQWEPMEMDVINRKAKETWLEWWERGVSKRNAEFVRAMAAPLVFPETILAVDSWTRRTKDSATVLMTIVSRDGDQTNTVSLPVRTASSATIARRELGMEANDIIAKLVKEKRDKKHEE